MGKSLHCLSALHIFLFWFNFQLQYSQHDVCFSQLPFSSSESGFQFCLHDQFYNVCICFNCRWKVDSRCTVAPESTAVISTLAKSGSLLSFEIANNPRRSPQSVTCEWNAQPILLKGLRLQNHATKVRLSEFECLFVILLMWLLSQLNVLCVKSVM